MRGLLGSIIGKLAASATGGVEPGLEKHFAALDKAERGLARKVASYVTDGSGGAVLATLGTPAITAIWRGQARSYPRTTPALRMLATPSSDAMLMRYGEVLAMLEPAPSNSHWGAFGTKTSPDWIRHAFSSDVDRRRTEPLCTVDRLAHVAALGDASPSAVLDIVFHPGPGVAYGTQHSVERFAGVAEWLGAHVAVVTEAQAKLDASGRMELAHAIGRMKLVSHYLPLLIDYGTSTAKTVRAAAMKALTAAPHDTLSVALADRYASAVPGVRAELVTLAVGTLGVDAHALLRGWRETETDKRPGEALDRALANVALSEAPKAAIGPATGNRWRAH